MVHRPPVASRQRSAPAASTSRGPQRPPRTRTTTRRGRAAAALLALALAASAHYTVKPGDTLSSIAAQHGTSAQAIADANGIADVDRIVAGSSLAIPGASGGSGGGSTTSGGSTHVVQPGETLSGIAVRYGVRSAAIAEANGIKDRNRIVAGRRLTIPGPTATASSGETRVQAAGAAPAATGKRADVGALIEQTARAHGWNPAFVKAVAWQESGWNNATVSPRGAVGVMQILPATGTWISTYLNGGRVLDLNDPADNVLGGILFLDYLHGVTGGDVDMILAGYFQGLASVERNGVFPSTKQYIANVKALRERF